jgi:GMP synthase-like glutamine amidotransferase
MRAAVFRHTPPEHLGLIEDELRRAGVQFEYIDMEGGAEMPPVAPFDALISMGGPMSANDGLPFLRREMELIREAAGAGKAVLGICLGAQLIAKALGARVYRNAVTEIGWFPVYWTAAARTDPLFAGLAGEPETVFHWHGETFDLPEGAEWLAWSERCRHQAFRCGATVYGLQFHLEVTPAMIEDWVRHPDNSAGVNALAAPIDPLAGGQRLARIAGDVFRRWCRLVR